MKGKEIVISDVGEKAKYVINGSKLQQQAKSNLFFIIFLVHHSSIWGPQSYIFFIFWSFEISIELELRPKFNQ